MIRFGLGEGGRERESFVSLKKKKSTRVDQAAAASFLVVGLLDVTLARTTSLWKWRETRRGEIAKSRGREIEVQRWRGAEETEPSGGGDEEEKTAWRSL